MRLLKIFAGMLAAAMFMLSAVSGLCYADIVIADGDIDPETGLIFTLLEDDTYSVSCPDINRDTLTGDITIPATFKGKAVTEIGEYGFEGCSNIESVTISNGVKKIRNEAFLDCDTLKSVSVPVSVISFDIEYNFTYVFRGCTSLEEILVDDKNTKFCSVGGTLFTKDKTVLLKYPSGRINENYIVPNTVKTIGGAAFNECNNLKTVTMGNNVNTISNSAFQDCLNLETIYLSASVNYIYAETVRGCKALKNIEVSGGNNTFCSENGVLLSKDKTSLMIYPAGKTENTYNIPQSVSTIWNCAFQECAFLKSIIIPSNVTNIHGYAFDGCEILENIHISAGVQEIGSDVFRSCRKLLSITVDEENVSYCAVDGLLFSKNMENLLIYPEGKSDTVYAIPEGVKKIVPIYNDNLEKLIFPHSLEVPPYMSSWYRNKLKLEYNGTVDEWNGLIGGAADYIKESYSVYTVICTDGKVGVEKPVLPTPKNVRQGDIFGRIAWDPVEGAQNYHIKVENTVTDKNGEKSTFVSYISMERFGNVEDAWVDWVFYAAPYSDEEHRIYVQAYADGIFSDYSTPFIVNYTPSIDETIRMPDKVWVENNILKWAVVDAAGMYWLDILANGVSVDGRISYSSTNQQYIDNFPREIYDVEMYVIDKNHVTFNKKIYPVEIGKVPIDSIWVPEISYDSDLDKIVIAYEDDNTPPQAFWIRIKDENGKLVRLERSADSSYLIGELPIGEYIIDVCAEAHIDKNSDFNDFSRWSPSIKLSKQDTDPDKPNTSEPTSSDTSDDTSGDTSEPAISNPDDTGDDTSGNTSGDTSSDTSSDTSGDTSDDTSSGTNDTSDSPSSDTSSDTSSSTSNDTSSNISIDTSDNTSSDSSGDTSSDTSDGASTSTGDGESTKDVQIGADAPNTGIVTPMGALLDSVLTAEELEQYKNGADIKITITSNDISSSVTSADVRAVKNALSDFWGYNVGMYVDMRIFKSVGGNVNAVHDLNSPITVRIEIPENLRKIGREFIVVRVHDGKATVLNDYDDNDNTITFRTDKFSTYAIAYKDKSGTTGAVSIDSSNNPYTGYKSNQTFFFVIGCVSLFVFVTLCLFTGKNGMTEEQKERKFTKLIVWGKKGGKIRAAIALTVIFLLLSFYYGIGMKKSAK